MQSQATLAQLSGPGEEPAPAIGGFAGARVPQTSGTLFLVAAARSETAGSGDAATNEPWTWRNFADFSRTFWLLLAVGPNYTISFGLDSNSPCGGEIPLLHHWKDGRR